MHKKQTLTHFINNSNKIYLEKTLTVLCLFHKKKHFALSKNKFGALNRSSFNCLRRKFVCVPFTSKSFSFYISGIFLLVLFATLKRLKCNSLLTVLNTRRAHYNTTAIEWYIIEPCVVAMSFMRSGYR